MSIFIDKSTRVVVQGITGRDGSFHAKQMIEYGTQVVAGVTPGKGGAEVRRRAGVRHACAEAVAATGANTSRDLRARRRSPPTRSIEAADAGHRARSSCITEGMPVLDMVARRTRYAARARRRARLLGPNCPGLISPGQVQGRHHARAHLHARAGRRRVAQRHAHLRGRAPAHAAPASARRPASASAATRSSAPTSSTRSPRSRPIPRPKAIVMMGEIGGTDEEEAAEFIDAKVTKPVVGFIAGQTAPPGKRMGHAGAIISGGTGTAAEKIAALRRRASPSRRSRARFRTWSRKRSAAEAKLE